MKPTEPRDTDSAGSRPTDPVSGPEPGTQSPSDRMDGWDERVVALHDGRLGAGEREAVLAQLLADDDEYELFAETAAVLAGLEAAHGIAPPVDAVADDGVSTTDARVADAPVIPVIPVVPGEIGDDAVIPLDARRPPAADPRETPSAGASPDRTDHVVPIESRRRTGGRSWLKYGALAAGIAAIGLGITLTRPPERFDDPAKAGSLLEHVALEPGWDAFLPDLRRSKGDFVPKDPAHFRLGSLVTALDFAVTARDTTAAQIADKLEGLLGDLDDGETLADHYRQIALSVRSGRDVYAAVQEARTNVGLRFSGEWYELGVWSEAARTAAIQKDAGFFRSRASRGVLKRAEETLTDADLREALTGVREAIPAKSDAEWANLQARIDDFRGQAAR